MKIAFGCDHKGFVLKKAILNRLSELGHETVDLGTYDTASVHYPIYGEKVARLVASGECERGVLVCGTGYGISLAANHVRGIRAVCCSDVYTAALTRSHNDANVLSLGAMVVGEGLALMILDTFLNTPFAGGRHSERLRMLDEIDTRNP